MQIQQITHWEMTFFNTFTNLLIVLNQYNTYLIFCMILYLALMAVSESVSFKTKVQIAVIQIKQVLLDI